MSRTRSLLALGLALVLQLPLAAAAAAAPSGDAPSTDDALIDSDAVFPFVLLLLVLAAFVIGGVTMFRRGQANRGRAPAGGTTCPTSPAPHAAARSAEPRRGRGPRLRT